MPSDVAALRALAHPTRTRIVALLRERASMTATECAGILHLTPKTCSYHLATLASSGLIEEIPMAGRNRPWRLTPDALATTDAPAPIPRRSVRDRREESLLDAAAAAIGAAPAGWTEAATIHVRVATMTPDEVAAWCEEVERVTSRHVRRSGRPDVAGRAAVELMFVGFPAGN